MYCKRMFSFDEPNYVFERSDKAKPNNFCHRNRQLLCWFWKKGSQSFMAIISHSISETLLYKKGKIGENSDKKKGFLCIGN